MNSHDLGLLLWNPSLPVIIIVAITYATPVVHILLKPFKLRSTFAIKTCKLSGISEIIIAPIRDSVGLFILSLAAASNLINLANAKNVSSLIIAIICMALIAASFVHRFIRTRSLLALCEFAGGNPEMHPQDFFDYIFCCYGFLQIKLPQKAARTIDLANIDFRTEKESSPLKRTEKILGAWTTMRMTSLVTLVRKRLGFEALRNISPALTCIWASRTAQIIESSLTIEGLAAHGLHPCKRIYIFTHKSFFDFIFAPLVPISLALREKNCPRTLPSFIVAAGHFRRNPIFTYVFGIGKAARNLNMLFVERTGKKKTARDATINAARMIVDEGQDIALFPQGARALPYYPLNGGLRSDAGYYTVGSKERIGAYGKQLKSGLGFICAEAIRMLGENSKWRIEIIPVAISGTANACPRDSMKIFKNVSLKLTLGEPIELIPENSSALFSSATSSEKSKEDFARTIIKRADTALKSAAKIHAELERRFFRDVRSLCDALKFDEVAVAMKSWRGDDYLVHSIIDIIYTCPTKEQRPLVGKLIYMLLNFAERNEILEFKKTAAKLLG